MAPAPARVLTLQDRIAAAVRREAKKAAVLTFLLALLGVLWVRMALKKSAGPQQAVAATVGALTDTSNATKSTVVDPTSLKAWIASPPRPIQRNLFAVNLD